MLITSGGIEAEGGGGRICGIVKVGAFSYSAFGKAGGNAHGCAFQALRCMDAP